MGALLRDTSFPAPKIFTNALLYNQEITALIRDTEPHESALFSIDPTAVKGVGTGDKKTQADAATRRRTILPGQQRHTSAVARVLGNDMLRQIQQTSRDSGRARGVNVEVLLQGAERLCTAFDVSGTSERVSALRDRYAHVSASVSAYEDKLHDQRLKGTRHGHVDTLNTEDAESENTMPASSFAARMAAQPISDDDLRAEEEAIRELEARKRALEERVAGMEKDLGGLLT